MQIKTEAALFVDADNVTPASLEKVLDDIDERGWVVNLRRAYGGIAKLGELKDVLHRHGVKSSLNHGKGTTDVALVVDVMDLLHEGRLPGHVALATSDADFAPMALRLREAGVHVVCYAQRDKAAPEQLRPAYAELVFVAEPGALTEPHAATSPAALQRVSKVPVSEVAPKVVSGTDAEDERRLARQILEALPEKWLPNTIRQLNQLGGPLRKRGIKKGSKPLHDLFRKCPSYFKVLPMTGQAKQVRLLQGP